MEKSLGRGQLRGCGRAGLLTPAHCRPARSKSRSLAVNVYMRDRPQRLLAWVLSAPRRVENYFDSYPIRKLVWCGISFGLGFYSGNVLTLSFGALAINDVVASVLTVVFYEVATKAFYSVDKPSLRLWFVQCFKMGLVVALFADALKLQM